MVYETIRFEQPEPQIAVVTLSRPERLNAIDGPMIDELCDALRRIEADARLRAWILTGAPRPDGRPCFGAGVDLRAFEEGRSEGLARGAALTLAIDDSPVPSIAAIDGICTTGAAELALACDFRVVGAAARISDWHLKRLGTGLGAWGASTRWARLLGASRAKEVVLLGRELDAAEALRLGFATEACESAAVAARALAMARTIAAMDPRGVRLSLAHLDHVDDMTRDQALRMAELLPGWLGVEPRIEEKADAVLGPRSAPQQQPRDPGADD